jgi:hypothetical protein
VALAGTHQRAGTLLAAALAVAIVLAIAFHADFLVYVVLIVLGGLVAFAIARLANLGPGPHIAFANLDQFSRNLATSWIFVYGGERADMARPINGPINCR